jgi:hypothetical protein
MRFHAKAMRSSFLAYWQGMLEREEGLLHRLETEEGRAIISSGPPFDYGRIVTKPRSVA